jgi:hypothetical protein
MTATEQAIKVLEEFLKLDAAACNELLGYRVKCNAALADHPTIQVAINGAQTKVGLIGVLNGILEAAGEPRVAICLDNEKLVGFTKYTPPASN